MRARQSSWTLGGACFAVAVVVVVVGVVGAGGGGAVTTVGAGAAAATGATRRTASETTNERADDLRGAIDAPEVAATLSLSVASFRDACK